MSLTLDRALDVQRLAVRIEQLARQRTSHCRGLAPLAVAHRMTAQLRLALSRLRGHHARPRQPIAGTERNEQLVANRASRTIPNDGFHSQRP